MQVLAPPLLSALAALAPQEAAPPAWTFLIYGAADNDADGSMFPFLRDVADTLAARAGVAVIVFMDRSAGHSRDAAFFGEDFAGARLYALRPEGPERLDGGGEFPEIALAREWEADSADPANLAKFIAFGKARFPARHYALLIYGHANGAQLCPDEQSRRAMGIPQLAAAVPATAAVDFLGLELCNMGGAEVAYEWRPGGGGFSADYLLAIPNAGPPLDWRRILGAIQDPAQLTPRQLGLLAVAEGERGRLAFAAAHPEHDLAAEAAACYDLELAGAVKQALDAFAAAAGKDPQAKTALERARDAALNYAHGRFDGERAFVDLYDLLQRAAADPALLPDTRRAAQAAGERVDALVLASFGLSAYPGFAPGRNGLFVVFPDGDAKRSKLFTGVSRAWGFYGWYAPGPFRKRGSELGGWTWCRDGAQPDNGAVENWFELLDAWFDEPRAGGVNGYSP